MLTSLANWVQDQVAAHGLSAIFVLMVLESACIPIPSEVTMIYAGYLVSQGDMVFWQAVLVGAFANLVGSWIAWGVGAYGVDYACCGTGHTSRHIETGPSLVRAIRLAGGVLLADGALVRTFISLPAGVARMPLLRFSVLTFLGCLPWCLLLVWIGRHGGHQLGELAAPAELLDYLVVVAAVALVGWWLLRRRRQAAV